MTTGPSNRSQFYVAQTLKGKTMSLFRLALCLVCGFLFSAAHADAIEDGSVCTDDIYTNCNAEEHSTERRAALKPFRGVPIVNKNAQDAERKAHDAILASARRLKWKILENKPAALRLQLDVRAYRVVVQIRIQGGSADVDYVDSANLNYEKDASGNESIHPSYHKWVRKLLKNARRSAKYL
jgi:hypothetical protein